MKPRSNPETIFQRAVLPEHPQNRCAHRRLAAGWRCVQEDSRQIPCALQAHDGALCLRRSLSDRCRIRTDRLELGAETAGFRHEPDEGPYRKTRFAAIFEKCRKTTDVEAVHLADFEEYEPSLGAPAAFACSPIFDGDRIGGVFAIQLSISEVDRVVSGDRGWEREGLGKTGESRAVGPDFLMRSNARQYVENPEAYLRGLVANGYSESTIAKIRAYGTTVCSSKPACHPSRQHFAAKLERFVRGV